MKNDVRPPLSVLRYAMHGRRHPRAGTRRRVVVCLPQLRQGGRTSLGRKRHSSPAAANPRRQRPLVRRAARRVGQSLVGPAPFGRRQLLERIGQPDIHPAARRSGRSGRRASAPVAAGVGLARTRALPGGIDRRDRLGALDSALARRAKGRSPAGHGRILAAAIGKRQRRVPARGRPGDRGPGSRRRLPRAWTTSQRTQAAGRNSSLPPARSGRWPA